MALKHVGRIQNTKKKCAVAYRVLPGDPNNCLIVMTESLDAADHDSLMKLIESNAAQSADEFAEAMARTPLSDGRIMLSAFHKTGKMVKVSTNKVEMTPNTNTAILLSELNETIAKQKGVTVQELAMKDPSTGEVVVNKVEPAIDPVALNTASTETEVLTDEVLAAQYRSQADAMFKEAKSLREQAEALAPTKRKSKTTADG